MIEISLKYPLPRNIDSVLGFVVPILAYRPTIKVQIFTLTKHTADIISKAFYRLLYIMLLIAYH